MNKSVVSSTGRPLYATFVFSTVVGSFG
ncbi:unnamed protein product [Acanthoscelides obtectus]|uniref:Uncharacterized protein n=1 Tax=Acanthoscelides obtectus TaxID=200917 RepID=A0A9P0L9B7_ACAOB|nr:unnamed protein product [Acanthoscelides obtectus]CAK1626734.1 hypothetical protein AOBTE_LOCUS4052 [Acanthoscelides obtectus]